MIITAALLALAYAAGELAPTRDAAVVGLSKFVWLLPVAQGLAAVTPLTGDPVVELHESMPTPFRLTLVYRAAVVAGVALATSIVLYLGMRLMNLWGGPPGLLGIFNTFGQGIFLVACAYVGASIAQTAQSVSLVVITAWIAMLFGLNAVIGDVLVNRTFLVLIAAGLMWIGYRRLGDTEHLLRGSKQ